MSKFANKTEIVVLGNGNGNECQIGIRRSNGYSIFMSTENNMGKNEIELFDTLVTAKDFRSLANMFAKVAKELGV